MSRIIVSTYKKSHETANKEQAHKIKENKMIGE
jgi:hypothetical protein